MDNKFLSKASAVAVVAQTIAHCDFRTTMSHYSSGPPAPWIVTVGETHWHRHLVVLNVNDDGSYADLGLLNEEQSARAITDIDTSAIERTLTLQELVADSYVGVKQLLTAELVG